MTGVDWTDAVGQAELVRTGAVSPTELVEAAIARIEATDPTIHAVVHERFEQARAEAAGPLPDGPFRGVPFLLKNLTVEIAGYVLDDGMRFLADAGYRSTATDPLGQRFLDAGLVVLGRTNACELGLLPTTEPELHGPTHNPWAPGHTPGGSSGGSAAAVAAGMTAMAHANDGGGSIRIPASCCGLVGLKPTRGRVPSGGSGNEIVNFLVCEGVVTRSVRDTAAMLDVIGAPRAVGPTRAPAPPGTFAGAVGHDPGRLRVGLLAHDPTGGAVDPECVAAVERTAALLEGLGHAVEPSFPEGWSDAEAMVRFSSVWMTETAEGLDHWADVVGRPVTEDDVEPLTWTLAQMGHAVTGPDFMLTASRALADAERDAAWWRPAPTDPGPGFDLLVTPTVAEPPVPHGTFPSTRDAPLTGFIRAGAFVPFTTQSNISGQPAISLPLHWTPDGRPVGVQLVAAFGREDVLLGVAAQLEAAAPWSDRHPPA